MSSTYPTVVWIQTFFKLKENKKKYEKCITVNQSINQLAKIYKSF